MLRVITTVNYEVNHHYVMITVPFLLTSHGYYGTVLFCNGNWELTYCKWVLVLFLTTLRSTTLCNYCTVLYRGWIIVYRSN